MRGVGGPDALLCLLLLLLAPHSPEGGRGPRRRFEYKLSFKGPRLALPGAGIPFWSHHGDAIPGLEEVRLAPSMRNRSGAVWSRASVPFPTWEVEMQMRVTGPGCRGAQGMALWYTRDRGQAGSALGRLAPRDGIGILFDSSAEDTQNSPAIRVLASDGLNPREPLGDGVGWVLGSCHRDFRNRPYPFRVRITYWGQRLRVSLNSGLTPSDPDEVCVDVGPLLLAPGGFFGISAATGTLADDHDVLSFLTFSLSEPGPEDPSQPFLEMEQLLARKLEGLRARLALDTRTEIIPKSDSETQERGERLLGLEETLSRHSQILQALQGLSEQLARAGRQWKEQLGSPGWARVDLRRKGLNPGPREKWLALLQDSVKVGTLLRGQQTLLQDLQAMRAAAARMASGAQVFYLPVGTQHHFLDLDQMLSLLQKDLRSSAVRGPIFEKVAAKAPRQPGRSPGAFSCLRPGIFLFFLLIQTVGFLCYVHFSRQELDKTFQDCLSTDSLPLSPASQVPRALGALRRQPHTSSMHA